MIIVYYTYNDVPAMFWTASLYASIFHELTRGSVTFEIVVIVIVYC